MRSTTGENPAAALTAHDRTAESRHHDAVPLQQGFLFHHRYDSGSGVDLIQVVVEAPKETDLDAYARAWQRAAARHEVLRTAFDWQGQRLVQRVEREIGLPVREEIWTGDEAGHPQRLADLLAADRAREFDLGTAPLLRAAVIRRPGAADWLLITFHHAILDGRALQLLLTEVFTEYEVLRTGGNPVAPARRPYSDFTRWYATHDAAPGRRFWADLLKRCPDPGDLPLPAATELPTRRPDTVRETGRHLDTALIHENAASPVSPFPMISEWTSSVPS